MEIFYKPLAAQIAFIVQLYKLILLTEARRWQSAAYCKKYMFENATYLIRGKHGVKTSLL